MAMLAVHPLRRAASTPLCRCARWSMTEAPFGSGKSAQNCDMFSHYLGVFPPLCFFLERLVLFFIHVYFFLHM